MTPRSYLFVPGNRPERFDKAMAAGADAVILDLEDAVPVQDKDSARDAVSTWLASHRQASVVDRADTACQVLVRVNAVGAASHAADVIACRMAGTAVDGLVLPKSEQVTELAALADVLPGLLLLPLIESPLGFANAQPIARAPGVQRLVFGTVDFQHEMGIDGEGEELLFFRSQLVLWSRLAGIAAPVDGVSTVLNDPVQMLAESQRARRLGFGAKLCIHPRQVAAVHQAFAPTPAQLDWARRVLAVAESAGGAAVALDGAMVDRPVILRAKALLDAVR